VVEVWVGFGFVVFECSVVEFEVTGCLVVGGEVFVCDVAVVAYFCGCFWCVELGVDFFVVVEVGVVWIGVR